MLAFDLQGFFHQADLVGLATATIVAATPLTLAALGGVMSERSGVVNIALEGIMLTTAFAGYAAALVTHNLALGLLAAIIAGMLRRSNCPASTANPKAHRM